MSDDDIVTVTMPGYIADGLAGMCDQRAEDRGWRDMATMLREGGWDAEVRVVRQARQ